MFGWTTTTWWGWLWKALLGALFLWAITGCSNADWKLNFDKGTHKTRWNHGCLIKWEVSTGLYIGPEKNSTTEVEGEWTAEAEAMEPQTLDEEPVEGPATGG